MNEPACFLRLDTVVRWYFFAVALVTTKTFVSIAGAGFRTVAPDGASAFLRAGIAVESWSALAVSLAFRKISRVPA
jgi:hypothetical protein